MFLRAIIAIFQIVFVTAFLFSCAAAAQTLSPHQMTAAQKQALSGGEVVVEAWREKESDDRAIDVFGAVEIGASPQTVWALMLDCDISLQVVERMTECEIMERAEDGSWDIRRQKTKINFLLSSTSVFRSDYTEPHIIRISRAGGDMKVQNGIWTLTPIGKSQTRLTYRARSAPKFPVPVSRLRRAMREDVPDILENLRQIAESRSRARTGD